MFSALLQLNLLPPGLFGQADFATNDLVSLLQNHDKSTPLDTRQLVILFGTLAIIAAVLFIMVAKYKKARQKELQRSPWPARASKNSPIPDKLAIAGRPRRHRRRRRPEFTTRNPTLAETGGLPPKRPTGQPPAF